MECIVLAGGLGTRLQGVIGAIPKCMAMVAQQPFLFHVLRYLEEQQCTKVILSLGYQHELVEQWLVATDWEFEIEIVVEDKPLGTGGAIALAIQKAITNHVLVLNGDTMFRIDLAKMMSYHTSKNAVLTLALKPMHNFDRYGTVSIENDGKINSFEEKRYQSEGLINGGVYLINRFDFLASSLPEVFSFEKDYLEHYVGIKNFWAQPFSDYFIDIGVPQDYEQAQIDFTTNRI